MRFLMMLWLLPLLISPARLLYAQNDGTTTERLRRLADAGVHDDDLPLIEANLQHFSTEQLDAIERFLSDPQVIAENAWFDVTQYTGWDDYNFYRPVGDTLLTNLARRDLFLDPARQLNNPALTNMSAEALAALAFSQVYVEEKWDHEVPWDGDDNALFNWVHPLVTTPHNLLRYAQGDYLDRARMEYWWVTYWSWPFNIVGSAGLGKGDDIRAALRDMQPPNANAPRLAGYAYPVGNQLYLQTAETAYWYADYLRYGAERYGAFEPQPLDTNIVLPGDSSALFNSRPAETERMSANPQLEAYPELWPLLHAPFAAELRRELIHPETAAFWNVMRFVHAGARQREGGASPEFPGNGQPAVIALRYAERSAQPVGRPTEDVSAFALLTTVYSDSILLDFTNWNMDAQSLLITPSDTTRSDGLHRQVSERNKAILVIEQMGDENAFPNATHIAGSRGLGFSLTPQYDDAAGDFLPYMREEAYALVMALVVEARDYSLESSRVRLCDSPLLKQGYLYALDRLENTNEPFTDWDKLTSELCPQN